MSKEYTIQAKLDGAINVLCTIQGNINAVGTVDETTDDIVLLKRYAFRLRVIQDRINSLLAIIDEGSEG